MSSLRRASALRLDLLLLPPLWLVDVLLLWVRMQHVGAVDGPVLVFLSILVYVPMVWCRQRPLTVLATVVLGSAAISVLAPGFHPVLCVWLGLFTAAVHHRRAYALLALGISIGATFLNVAELTDHALDPGDRLVIVSFGTVVLLLADLAAYGFGRWTRWSVLQRERVARLAAARAEAEERRRITRELHDVVAHTVSLMTLQAAGAARTLTADPERARTALHQVSALGEQATAELHAMLGYLSCGQGPQTDRSDIAWRLQDIGRVVEQVRMTGREIVVSLQGAPHPLEPAADQAAYRVVQEALTNAVKHADPHRPVLLDVTWGRQDVNVSIRTQGMDPRRDGLAGQSTRRGIDGMRERAHAVGGSLTAGPTRDGGFSVVATIPLAGRPARVEPPRRPIHAEPPRRPGPIPTGIPE